jgi:hypothetical protein
LLDPVRFCVRPGFGFPASDIHACREQDNDAAAMHGVNFMGLIGPKGVLPDWYNLRAKSELSEGTQSSPIFWTCFTTGCYRCSILPGKNTACLKITRPGEPTRSRR